MSSAPPAAALRTVYVRNLNWETKADALGQFARQFGEVKAVRIPTERYDNQLYSRGFGFVEFASDKAKNDMLAAKDLVLDGRTLIVREARAARQHPRDTLWIGGIPEGTKEEDLKGQFSSWHVKQVRIVRFNSESVKGYAFVQFETHEDQDQAGKAKKEITLGGQRSIVRWANPRRPSSRRFRRFRRAPRQPQASTQK